MLCIFREEKQVGKWKSTDRAIGSPVSASVTAWYDETVRVLVVDCDCRHGLMGAAKWVPPPTRLLKTIEPKSDAVREAIRSADEWYTLVADRIPPPEPYKGPE